MNLFDSRSQILSQILAHPATIDGLTSEQASSVLELMAEIRILITLRTRAQTRMDPAHTQTGPGRLLGLRETAERLGVEPQWTPVERAAVASAPQEEPAEVEGKA